MAQAQRKSIIRITITTMEEKIFFLNLPETLILENLRAFFKVELGFPERELMFVFNGVRLQDYKKQLVMYGVKNGDCLVLQQVIRINPQTLGANGELPAGAIPVPNNNSNEPAMAIAGPSNATPNNIGALKQIYSSLLVDDTVFNVNLKYAPAAIRDIYLSNPDSVNSLKKHNPRLAEALLSKNLDKFTAELHSQIEIHKRKHEARRKMLRGDAMDEETQRLIAEEIKQKNILDNMAAAIEFNPEIFGTVTMLFIHCKVNGIPVKAFVDSGAQTTIISSTCSERCNIKHLIDTNWGGVARGVGTQPILGRVHMVQLQIENDHLISSFTVLENQPPDMLLGLDMLKRYECIIDLQRNVLRIGTTGTETPFLPENELPMFARLTGNSGDTLQVLDESAKQAETEQLKRAVERSKVVMSSAINPHVNSFDFVRKKKFTEADVMELVKKGFKREEVIAELERQKGNKAKAIIALIAKSMQFNNRIIK